eukprot:GFUD01039510.1.p1 GENE.GFUD01039510.1~~GFUD01039510.1.p1  ORF type:complete len:539 (-),score=81.11 GFUD01039510.1:778-2394(-)
MGLLSNCCGAWRHISLEPVFFLYYINIGLIRISTEGLYLDKACKVNLNYTEEICDNIHNHTEVQKETQKFVSELQAYNGILQSAPAIIFTLFAGPLSDTYGRKPLIICALFGWFLHNIVFLVNSIWFYELKVEYLLFECLQDFTGGAICFYLACYSYMIDITTPDTRTRRLSILDGFMPIGFITGLPFGTYIKNNFGFVPLFSVAAGIIILAILYVFFFVKDSRKDFDETKMQEVENTKSNVVLGCNKDFFPNLFQIVTVGIRTIFKRRPNGGRTWIICFVLIFCLSKGIDSGSRVVCYMFYRLQYKIDNTIFSNLSSFRFVCMFISQIAVVPLLSGVLKCRDTTILMLAVFFNIVAHFIAAFNDKLFVLYICYVLWMLSNTITTTSRSNLSKLMDSTEMGKAFSVLGILQALLPVVSKPAFAFLYKMTIETFPAAFKLLTGSLYCIVLGLLVFTHVGLKRMDSKIAKSDPEELKELESNVTAQLNYDPVQLNSTQAEVTKLLDCKTTTNPPPTTTTTTNFSTTFQPLPRKPKYCMQP